MDLLLGGSLATLVVSGLTHAVSYLGDDLEQTPSVSYNTFLKEAKTGDLLLTSNPAPQTLTRIVTQSNWSHCGILVEDSNTGKFFEWSSRGFADDIPNSRGTKGFSGTQIVPLEHLASEYGGIYWRPLRKFGQKERDKLRDVIKSFAYHIPFADRMEFFAFLGGPFSTVLNGSSSGLACSHAVALSYMATGVMANDRHITQFTPATFSEEGDANWLVPISPITYKVSGFDTSGLIDLPKLNQF